ncbi:Re/Si-specific NAD(P)(+) transhydrogenase subunit alpha [Microbacterium sp. 4R-513]|uniref:Re/Si-specific NAD(P)(+) transhydrogenase subunit alpha n=1 Tax=Microbacterium sp. 4R-513 TaxID=2567934 RepID=UPI0013E11E2F|nr:Re/Si-specific NAD(P)(+) transhydrogenase subunit alpha [Microbacterium sp. 4R-513]QIG39124.1 Re/Si-specific NAD(P)(+) transhydrogenase subunit alpha [Microbacterium sp. 4R-513]
MTRIGIVAEQPGENRVAATPITVGKLRGLGYEVVVESGAGEASAFPDSAFEEAGAAIVDRATAWSAPIVLKVDPPLPDEVALLADGATLIGLLSPALRPEVRESLETRGITALALDAVPRISRAQSMDVLSSMANISGYRAVVEAAHEFGRFFTGQVTAAGKVPPAKVLVAGAGVAGLAAIGAASSLGAIVRATDPRPEVADQVRSIGGQYLPVEVDEQMRSNDGYAKATSEAYDRAAADLYSAQARDVDIIITTALIPGRPAPRLLTGADVAAMRPGSVIVDMAAAQGGNVEGSVAGERVVTDNGVVILGYTDLAGRLPTQASQLYGTNLLNLVKLLTPGKDGRLVLDFDDVVQRSITVVRDGESTWPPPPVAVSAAPQPHATAAASVVATPAPTPRRAMSAAARTGLIALGIGALFLVAAVAPDPLPQHFTVLMLSVVVGFYVIGHVHHALHTPLMSVTNAISGIIVVGAMLQLASPFLLVQVLAAIAVLLASINIFGGFSVTRRMLAMFQKGGSR